MHRVRGFFGRETFYSVPACCPFVWRNTRPVRPMSGRAVSGGPFLRLIFRCVHGNVKLRA